MSRTELVEWAVMIAIILLWWPIVFMGWGPEWYRYPLYVISFVGLVTIFRNRLRRLNEGFEVSEQMMQMRRQQEEAARGGKPDLTDAPGRKGNAAPDLPYMPGPPAKPQNADDDKPPTND